MATDGVVRIPADQRSAEAIIEVLNEGRELIIEQQVRGTTHETKRQLRDGIYYCQTPLATHTHETERGLRICLINLGHAAEDW
jgi:hypothetical protein